MSGVFESLGRAILCVDAEFRVVHASPGLDAIAGIGAAELLAGRSLEESFGADAGDRVESRRCVHHTELGVHTEDGASEALEHTAHRAHEFRRLRVHSSLW